MKTRMLTALILTVLAFGNTNTAWAQSQRTEEDIKREILEAQRRKATADAEKAEAEAREAKARAKNAEANAPLTREAEVRLTKEIGERALAHVQENGQEIATGSFPYAIGKVPYRFARLVGAAAAEDDRGYQATVKLYYTNILKDDFYMEVITNYDSKGRYRSWKHGSCNDKWATPKYTGKVFDQYLPK